MPRSPPPSYTSAPPRTATFLQKRLFANCAEAQQGRGGKLLSEFVQNGISAITLGITGSAHPEGLRACTSLVRRDQFLVLEERLKRLLEDHPVQA